LGRLARQAVVVMQGRVHYYEGYEMAEVTLPVRVMQALGVGTLIVTNAAGGLNPDFTPGDLMLITDHINLVGMTGHSPLLGPNIDELGPRFPGMSHAYSPVLCETARRVAGEKGLALCEGVYACVAGPSYETPAEVRFLRSIGADAVGMSTASEVVVARHGGLPVLGVSGITNVAASEPSMGRDTTHEEVLEAGKVIGPKMMTLLMGVLAELG